ncbi:MobF family relaxase [Phytoactinopolyspora mesophila]|uniref:MobF family relaxase n=1 Tax=Phytoactinopolyspora mesophila TaxID=2650750 RepID=UPI001C9E4235
MKGGVILFRGAGSAARRYLESDRSQADEYYLEVGTALAEFAVIDGGSDFIGESGLTPKQYADWVDWINPLSGESMGRPRLPGEGRQGSPRFAEMVINTPKSLSIAAALHPDVSDALDVAQRDAVTEIRRWLGEHSVTRVGPRGRQEVAPVEQLQTVAVSHRTSRAGDPHRHVHFQIGTRVWAAGKWRALDTAALFKQQGAIRALGTAVLAAHPGLAGVLEHHRLSLDPVTGEVAELEPFNAVMSKRAEQVQRNLARMEDEWEAAHPGGEPGPVVRSRMITAAWAHERPNKKPRRLPDEMGWQQELVDAGYDPATLTHQAKSAPASLDDLRVQEVANRALDRCAASASTWTRHTIQDHVTRITNEAGVRATPGELREFITMTTGLAAAYCFSVLSPDDVQPDHVAHLTSLRVVHAETQLRDLLHARLPEREPRRPDVAGLAARRGLDEEQTVAAAAVASTDPLVVVEGAAGAGKTTMLRVAIEATQREGRQARVVAPTKKAADVAQQELGVAADSVAALVYAHGWRWNDDGVWTRLGPGDTDPDTGLRYDGRPEAARLAAGERVIVDEAGMLDQDTALALLTVTAEADATVALVGDRAQLPAVGRGGVLDMAAHIRGTTFDMAGVHRFTDAAYADLTLHMRTGTNPAVLLDRLHALGLIRLHGNDEAMREHIATTADEDDAITVATNDQVRAFNERIRAERVQRGEVDDARTVTGSDGLSIGVGDVIQTRRNDRDLRVSNRQTWIVQHVGDDGALWVIETGNGRKRQHTAALPSEYVGEHAHLAYVSTAYGVQGATVSEAHTILSDSLDAAGVYVGMTRGRSQNVLHIVAENFDEAREQFAAAMERDRADRGLAVATQAAGAVVAGLTNDGPVRLVNTERARLAAAVEHADHEITRWQQVVTTLAEQRRAHRDEQEEYEAAVVVAESHVAQVHAEVTKPLFEQATRDGDKNVAARSAMWDASAAHRSARRFNRHTTARKLDEAAAAHRAIEQAARERWGTVAQTAESVTRWAEAVAEQRAGEDSRLIDARQRAQDARAAERQLVNRHLDECNELRRRLNSQPGIARYVQGSPENHLAQWRQRAATLRRDLAHIEALPVSEAAQLIRRRRAEAEAEAQRFARRVDTERQAQFVVPDRDKPRRSEPGRAPGR